MTNLFGLCCLALAFFITAMPEASPEHVVIKPDSYQQAEHFGCQEVAKVCRIKHRMTSVTERKHVAGR